MAKNADGVSDAYEHQKFRDRFWVAPSGTVYPTDWSIHDGWIRSATGMSTAKALKNGWVRVGLRFGRKGAYFEGTQAGIRNLKYQAVQWLEDHDHELDTVDVTYYNPRRSYDYLEAPDNPEFTDIPIKDFVPRGQQFVSESPSERARRNQELREMGFSSDIMRFRRRPRVGEWVTESVSPRVRVTHYVRINKRRKR